MVKEEPSSKAASPSLTVLSAAILHYGRHDAGGCSPLPRTSRERRAKLRCGSSPRMVGFAALLLEPIFADSPRIEFLAPAHHRPNGLIGNQRAGDGDDAHEQESHLPIFEYSSPGCNRIASVGP